MQLFEIILINGFLVCTYYTSKAKVGKWEISTWTGKCLKSWDSCRRV